MVMIPIAVVLAILKSQYWKRKEYEDKGMRSAYAEIEAWDDAMGEVPVEVVKQILLEHEISDEVLDFFIDASTNHYLDPLKKSTANLLLS